MNTAPAVVALSMVALGGLGVVLTRDPLRQAMVVSFFGMLLGILFFVFQAPDVALSAIAVGAVASPLMILLALAKVRAAPSDAAGADHAVRRRRLRAWRCFSLGVFGAPGLRSLSGPLRRRPQRRVRPGTSHHRRRHGRELRLPRLRHTGRGLILFAAVIGVAILLRAHRDEEEREALEFAFGRSAPRTSDAVRALAVGLVGPTVVTGVYIVAHGHLTPGGGFQGGVVLATALLLVYLAGGYAVLPQSGAALCWSSCARRWAPAASP